MGKVDQGVFTHWMLSHYFRRDLTYLGYGGKGKQVRDLISIDDVVDLVEDQLVDPDRWAGFVGNVGGGREISLSLLETTELCRELTGNTLQIEGDSRTRKATSRSTCPTAICYTGIPAGGRNAGRSRSWKRSSSGSETTSVRSSALG